MKPAGRDIPPSGSLVHDPAGRATGTPAGANVAEAKHHPRFDLSPGTEEPPVAESGSGTRSTEGAKLVRNKAGQGVWLWPDGHRELAILPEEDRRMYVQYPEHPRRRIAEGLDEKLLD